MPDDVQATGDARNESQRDSLQRVGMRTEQEPSANSTSDAVGGGGVGGFDLWPGFKTPPTVGDPPRTGLTVAPQPPPEYDADEDYRDGDEEEETCKHCDGWGYNNCFCGGDLCVCDNNGEEPCYYCC